MSYVGNAILANGTNPFVTLTTSTNLTWLWILLACLFALLLILGTLYFINKKKKNNEQANRANYEYVNEVNNNNELLNKVNASSAGSSDDGTPNDDEALN